MFYILFYIISFVKVSLKEKETLKSVFSLPFENHFLKRKGQALLMLLRTGFSDFIATCLWLMWSCFNLLVYYKEKKSYFHIRMKWIVPECHHSTSVSRISSQQPSLRGSAWGLWMRTYGEAIMAREYLDYKYWGFVRTIWVLVWVRRLFTKNSLKTLGAFAPVLTRHCSEDSVDKPTVALWKRRACPPTPASSFPSNVLEQ